MMLRIEVYIEKEKISKTFLTISKKGMEIVYLGDPCSVELQKKIESWIASYMKGANPTVELPLNSVNFSDFKQQVIGYLKKLPFGSTVTYGELAELIGHPKAQRAVGTACGSNPWPLFIPCHRVIASGGKVGGFSLPIEIKRLLIDFEQSA